MLFWARWFFSLVWLANQSFANVIPAFAGIQVCCFDFNAWMPTFVSMTVIREGRINFNNAHAYLIVHANRQTVAR
jgi:hypothetical protein